MSKETFEECMKRLFVSLNPNSSWKSINRLDLFEILFNDRQKKIDELEDKLEEAYQNQLAAENKNHYLQLCHDFRDRCFKAEAENKELREAVKSLRELAIDLWENDASETDWLDVDYFHELIDRTEALAKLGEKGEG